MYKPLIADYQPKNTNSYGIFHELKTKIENETPGKNNLHLFGFGKFSGMQGKVSCPRKHIPFIHDELKEKFVNGQLNGSIAVCRMSLPYQHFVLDFDFKKIITVEPAAISTEEYRDYIQDTKRCKSDRKSVV